MKLYYQLSGFSGHYTLQQISLYLTSSQSAWGSGRNLWWGWGPLGGSHTMECHWYSPAHHQSSSSGTRLPCPHLQSVAEKKREIRWWGNFLPKILLPGSPQPLSQKWGRGSMAPESSSMASRQQLRSWSQAIIYWSKSLGKPLRKEAIQ